MIAALIIAAGKTASRDGFHPGQKVGTITALQRITRLFQRAGAERIVAVYDEEGDKGEKTEKPAPYMNVIFLRAAKDAEMLDNVKIGLAYLADKCTAAMILHSDAALFSVETLRALMAAEGPVCIPSRHGDRGHPMLLRAEHFDAVLSYTGEGGLSGAIKASGLPQTLVEVEDEGILADLRDENASAHLLAGDSLRESYPEIRIRIVREKPFYGPGAHQYMQLVEETGSMREACRRMNISYSKGRAIVAQLEQQLGHTVITSYQGGKTGGYSVVTEEGRDLMRKFSAYQAEAKQYLHALFRKYFSAGE